MKKIILLLAAVLILSGMAVLVSNFSSEPSEPAVEIVENGEVTVEKVVPEITKVEPVPLQLPMEQASVTIESQ